MSLLRSALASLAVLFVCALVEAAPTVPAFERFHASSDEQLAAGGRLLLGELNCVSCHAVAAPLRDEKYVLLKKAPVLTTVGDRVRPERLRTIIGDPLTAKPGTTMPAMFHDLPQADKDASVDALVHYLVSTGTGALRDAIPDKKAVERGHKLFSEIGCNACHQPSDPKAAAIATSFPIGNPGKKYTLDSLAKFLRDPLAVRPSGRMPSLNLDEKQARDIATWFLRDVEGEANVKYSYYEGKFEKLPDFAKLKPTATGECVGFDLDVAKRKNDYAIRFEAYITLDKAEPLTFHLNSDDGSRLIIDDQVVIDHDGVHPPSDKSWEWKFQGNTHKLVLEFFQGGGGAELTLEMSARGPNQPRLLVDSYLHISPEAKQPTRFQLDPAKVAKGRELFASAGCASCHELKENDKPIASTNKGHALDKLTSTTAGCLAEKLPSKTPNLALSAQQKKALAAAIDELNAIKLVNNKAPARDPKQVIAHTFAAFNCYACHTRDNVGGVEQARDALFLTTVKEMGDEGRLPPKLDGVGGKLTEKWLKQLLNEGSKDRQYMLTKMPRFGANNIGHLATPLYELDKLPPLELPEIIEPEYRLKGEGRLLIGSRGFSCVKCHNFDKITAEGVPGINFTIFTSRLRQEWFHRYVRDPQSFRAGTRMPSAWPKTGKSLLPRVLDGDCDKQVAAVWTYLKDGTKAAVPIGMGSQPIELVAETEAVVYRNFIEGSGARAIAVAHPEKANFSFDANQMRLAIIWHGQFIDASKHWVGRGPGYQTPLGDHILQFADGVSFAKLADPRASWPATSAKEAGYKFLGYSLGDKQRPTLRYSFDGVTVEDFIRPQGTDKNPNLLRTMTLSTEQPPKDIHFRAATGRSIEPQADGWYLVDKLWRMRVSTPGASAIVRQADNGAELLVPLIWQGKQIVIEQEFNW
jgi:mono/diheme cytochrome c family protein